MVVDNTAYISTSLRGKGSYIYDPALSAIKSNHQYEGPVLEGLRRCQERSIDVDGKTRIHRKSAKCGKFTRRVGLVIGLTSRVGEYMAALAFGIDTRQQRDLSDARVVTIIRDDQKGENVVIPPCDKTNSKNHVSVNIAETLW